MNKKEKSTSSLQQTQTSLTNKKRGTKRERNEKKEEIKNETKLIDFFQKKWFFSKFLL